MTFSFSCTLDDFQFFMYTRWLWHNFFAQVSGSSELHVEMKNIWNINALLIFKWHFGILCTSHLVKFVTPWYFTWCRINLSPNWHSNSFNTQQTREQERGNSRKLNQHKRKVSRNKDFYFGVSLMLFHATLYPPSPALPSLTFLPLHDLCIPYSGSVHSPPSTSILAPYIHVPPFWPLCPHPAPPPLWSSYSSGTQKRLWRNPGSVSKVRYESPIMDSDSFSVLERYEHVCTHCSQSCSQYLFHSPSHALVDCQ